ncbi:hypothetical protein LIN78_14715 [Leeia sp. TBRC 13508]|uniref:Lipoprotein n=1 Tax=Leeia speluncae TaxID=2884804 RepID=A0ABS8D9J4_9NEIS|nr:hypothetical protein [Leeia speluncae]MCB6184797.1 hypothetical protein [Leeia speluncae]
MLQSNVLKPMLVGGLLAMSLAGCVTINIYFPAAAAEKAADKIIDEVLQVKPIAKTNIEKPASN